METITALVIMNSLLMLYPLSLKCAGYHMCKSEKKKGLNLSNMKRMLKTIYYAVQLNFYVRNNIHNYSQNRTLEISLVAIFMFYPIPKFILIRLLSPNSVLVLRSGLDGLSFLNCPFLDPKSYVSSSSSSNSISPPLTLLSRSYTFSSFNLNPENI